jgi:hypothetical protein
MLRSPYHIHTYMHASIQGPAPALSIYASALFQGFFTYPYTRVSAVILRKPGVTALPRSASGSHSSGE